MGSLNLCNDNYVGCMIRESLIVNRSRDFFIDIRTWFTQLDPLDTETVSTF